MIIVRRIVAGLMLAGVACATGCGKSETTSVAQTESQESGPERIGSAMQNDPNPTVSLRTKFGVIKLRLNAEKAPITVDNFLAQVEAGFYNETIFHQVEPGYVLLGGGYNADLREKPSRYSITNEADNGLENRRGTIAMARPLDGIESSTGQFFINLGDNGELNHRGPSAEHYGFCVFGEVIEGMDVVDRISQVKTREEGDLTHLPVQTVLIETATRLR
ncbi:MAG TPA: peptidylprolyl isomerase [Pirellulales bacterium]|jgi:peptidyl-prolyl cis-trans isomerase B (cyclophilin B)